MVTGTAAKRPLGRIEFTGLLAMSMAIAAVGIDLMLPAFGVMRTDLGLGPGSTRIAGIVTAYFLGLALGQVAYGPLADRFGRKPALYLGYGVYALGALASVVSPSLEVLLVARFVWGLGAAGPRVVVLAVIRDSYDGERMARAMSFVMAVFILVPVMAPTLGAAIVAVVSWRWLFALCLLFAVGMALWARRLPETLAEENRLELRVDRLAQAVRTIVTHRETVLYTLALTALFGVFTSYIASSEIIIGDALGAGDRFPLVFGGLAAVMGAAMVANATVVGRVGTRRLAHVVLLAYVASAVGLTVLAVVTDGRPPLAAFLVAMAVMLASHALLIPNVNTIAMAPMGAVAGTAASVIGAVSTAVGALLGSVLDRAFDGTIRPMAFGFLGYGLVALALVLVAERGRLFRPLVPPAGLPPTPPPEA